MYKCSSKKCKRIEIPQSIRTGPPGKGIECDTNHNLFAGDVKSGGDAENATIFGCGAAIPILNSSYTNSVIFGFQAGNNLTVTTGSQVIIGYEAGQSSSINSVCVGPYSGKENQGPFCIAIGFSAGQKNQHQASIGIGSNAGATEQGDNAIAIGNNTAILNQGVNSIAIGFHAGNTEQKGYSVALGGNSGYQNQGARCVAIGNNAGYNTQENDSIAIGDNSGYLTQGTKAIAIGRNAGYTTQGVNSISIGYLAGSKEQKSYSICIGDHAGIDDTGENITSTYGLYFPNSKSGHPLLEVGSGVAVHYDADSGQMGPMTSSQEYKTDIESINIDSSIIYNLNLKSFKYKSNLKNTCLGYIAEEVEEIDSELIVYMTKNGKKVPYSIKYNNLIFYIIEELKKIKLTLHDNIKLI
jgi:hypothetical protein